VKRFIGLSALALATVSLVGFETVLAPPAVAADKLFFEGDMVRGRPKSGPTGPVCVLTSQFKQGEMVVWRVRVLDPAKSEQLGKAGLKSLVVELPDGEKVKMHFGTHPRKKATDSFWSGSWQIPANYPTGSLSYKVVATDQGGKVHSWTPFNVRNSQLTVVAGKMK